MEKGNSGFQSLHQQVGFWITQSSYRKQTTHKNWNLAILHTLCQLLLNHIKLPVKRLKMQSLPKLEFLFRKVSCTGRGQRGTKASDTNDRKTHGILASFPFFKSLQPMNLYKLHEKKRRKNNNNLLSYKPSSVFQQGFKANRFILSILPHLYWYKGKNVSISFCYQLMQNTPKILYNHQIYHLIITISSIGSSVMILAL